MRNKCVYLLFFALCEFPLVSHSSETNGTTGASLLWSCRLSEPFQKLSWISWQTQDDTECLHYYRNGEEDLEHQSPSFKGRTKTFPDLVPSGNLSLLIDPLKLTDDQKSVKVILMSDSIKTFCQTTVHVAAPFEVPNIEINTKNMTAACRTKGGFPKPELSWSSMDHEGCPLQPPDVRTSEIHEEADGSYSITSTAGIEGSRRVSCRVYNPTSNETLSVTEDVPAQKPAGQIYGVCVAVILPFVLLGGAIIWIIRNRRKRRSGQL